MVDERVVEFRDALRAGDAAAIVEAFDGFDAAVDTQEARERAVRDVARGIIARSPPDAQEHQSAQQFLRAVSDAQEARISAKYDFALYLQEGPSADRVADSVDRVIETTAAVEDAINAVRDDGRDLMVPPALSVTGPNDVEVASGEAFEAEYTVRNVGVSPAGGLDVAVEGPDLSATPGEIESLGPDETATVTVSGSVDETTERPLVLTVGAATVRSTVVVLDERSHLERALTIIEEIEAQIDALGDEKDGGSPQGGNASGLDGLREKLVTARERITEIMEALDGDTGRPVDKQIDAASRLMGAFVNQTHGLGNRQLADRTEALLAHDAGRAIDELRAAAEAYR